MSPDEREEQASLYALGLLEGAELAAFEREMANDLTIAALVAEFEAASAQISLAAPSTTPPPAVKDAILRVIFDQQRAEEPAVVVNSSAKITPGWIPWALAAGFAVFVGGLIWSAKMRSDQAFLEVSNRSASLIQENTTLQSRVSELDAERLRLEQRISTLEAEKKQQDVRIASLEGRDPLTAIRVIAFAAQPEAPQAAEVAALWDPRHQTGVLDLSKLPAPAADKDYQLWILTPDSTVPISAGVISTASPQANFRSPRPLPQVAALAISLEPKGGSEAPRGPVIYIGNF